MKNSFSVNGLNREQVELVDSAIELMVSTFKISKDDALRLMLTQGALQANRCVLREETIFHKEILKLIAETKSKKAAKHFKKVAIVAEFKRKRQKYKEIKKELQNGQSQKES